MVCEVAHTLHRVMVAIDRVNRRSCEESVVIADTGCLVVIRWTIDRREKLCKTADQDLLFFLVDLFLDPTPPPDHLHESLERVLPGRRIDLYCKENIYIWSLGSDRAKDGGTLLYSGPVVGCAMIVNGWRDLRVKIIL